MTAFTTDYPHNNQYPLKNSSSPLTKALMISIVVPVYNAENCLDELHRRIKAAIQPLTDDYEIILVDDGSSDCSWQVINNLHEQDKRVRGIHFSRNFGQHYGITAGLDYCRGSWAIIMDCDLQDPPEIIPDLYRKATTEKKDVVLVRRKNGPESLMRKFLSKNFYRLFRYLSGMKYESEAGNFCIISHCVLKHYRSMREQLRFFGGLINWTGFVIDYIDVRRESRFDGKSTYTFRKRLNLAMNAIIAYSDKPLKFSIKIGFVIALLSLIYGLYILSRGLIRHVPVPGWSSLMVSIYFLSGITIANLGIIGIYLSKIFDEVKQRPLYVVKEIIPDEL